VGQLFSDDSAPYLAEGLRAIGHKILVLAAAPLVEEIPFLKDLEGLLGGLFSRVHDLDAAPHGLSDYVFEDGVMSAAHDEDIDPGFPEVAQIFLGDEAGDLIMLETFLNDGHEEGTGPRKNLHIRIELSDRSFVGHALDRRPGADDPHSAALRVSDRLRGAGTDDADHRDGHSSLQYLKGEGGRGVAGNNEELDALREQEEGAFEGVFRHHPGRLVPVGNSRGITEIDDMFMGEKFFDLFEDGHASDPGIEHSDGEFLHGYRLGEMA